MASVCVCGTQKNQKMKTEASYYGSNFKIIVRHAKYNQERLSYASVGVATSYFALNICHAASLETFEILG